MYETITENNNEIVCSVEKFNNDLYKCEDKKESIQRKSEKNITETEGLTL